jgi:hypothetical protein
LNSKQPKELSHVNKKSKVILEEKSRKGETYVPIHLRTENDIRKKMDNVNRIKDEMVAK